MRPKHCGLLLGITAFLLATSNAQAAERIALGVGGSFTQYFGYANNNDFGTGNFTGFDAKSDGEISFSGDTSLENGLQFGAKVILKSESAGADQIDAIYMWNEGDYGRVKIGQSDNAAAAMHYAAPDVGFGINDSDIADWVTNPGSGDTDSGFQSTHLFLGEDKATKLTWLSPRVTGFKLGVSYIPEFERDDNTQPNHDATYHDAIAAGLNFVQRFGTSTELAIAAGLITADSLNTVTTGAEGYSLGFNLTMSGFTVGASYASTAGNPSGGTDATTSFDGSGFDVGVAYALEAKSFSLSYYRGEVEDAVAIPGDSTHETIMASIAHEVGSGVTAMASLFHTCFEADSGTKNEGIALVSAVILEF